MWRDPARLRRDLPLNVVYDGNSLFDAFSVDAAHTVAAQAHPLIAAAFSNVTTQRVPVSGQTWRQMDGLDGGSSADVDAAYVAGARNVLVIWETTNALAFGGRSPTDAAGDAQAYMAHRLALHPDWTIVGLATLPRQGQAGSGDAAITAFNANLLATDAIMRANFRAWGGRAWIDVRCPGSPFRLPDYTAAGGFALNADLWNDPNGSRTHLTAAGYAIVAGLVARAVLALPAG